MARVIMFSRQFPKCHPKAGHPTYFVEKFLKSWDMIHTMNELMKTPLIDANLINDEVWNECQPKNHTIRAGHRFKAGDYFSPRVWSGKPYCSKQIAIAPDTMIVKTWDFEIREYGAGYANVILNDSPVESLNKIAKNDGLSKDDLSEWFKIGYGGKDFDGQIICWNHNINY